MAGGCSMEGVGVNEGEVGVLRDRSLAGSTERLGEVSLRLFTLVVGDVSCC